MAISIDVSYLGIEIPNAYLAIDAQFVAMTKNDISFSLAYRAAAEQAPFQSMPFSCPYLLDGGNPFVQAYEYLKTLPEFEGCTDC